MECEIEVLLAKNQEKQTTHKLENLKVQCKEVDEKCATYSIEANAHKCDVLNKEILGLNHFISQMERGGGQSLYPLPLECNPNSLLENIVVLNPCPFCELCYNCQNFIFVNFGHSYHPWCPFKHSRGSSKCLVKNCEATFTNEQCATMGFCSKASQSPIMTMVPLGKFVQKRGARLKQWSSLMMENKFAQLFNSLLSFNEPVQSFAFFLFLLFVVTKLSQIKFVALCYHFVK